MEENALDILKFYAASGVDATLGEAPVDRFAVSLQEAEEKTQKQAAQGLQGTAPSAPTNRGNTASLDNFDPKQIEQVQDLAKSASSIDELKMLVSAFDGCQLKKTAKNTVFSDGNPQAKLMLIGDAPGADDDRLGLPFAGRPGHLLDAILSAIGHDRTSVYISNILPWRPPGNRAPTPHEIELCRPFIERHIELANPDLIILLGSISAKTLLNENSGIIRLRGKWHQIDINGKKVPAMPTFHPSDLLRSPMTKAKSWADFLAARRKYQDLVANEA